LHSEETVMTYNYQKYTGYELCIGLMIFSHVMLLLNFLCVTCSTIFACME
jgi:hypothetical protein